MDELHSTQINSAEEQHNVSSSEDFYEKIEAPKFVDLNAPDHFHPGDDRFWFCLRVGCEQNHGEEMDSEVIYKNFVLRVMAARSPNIRLQRALYRKNSSTTMKCPQTVPAKSSKSRVTRLALISSISKRIADPKVKVKPISKQTATPFVKAKQSSVLTKALTTPRDKKRLSNPDAFRSVRNPKATAIAVPKNRGIAKTLVFHSPKKSARTKTSLELNTPVKTLCAGMKKLEITGGRKHVLGYSRQLPSDVSRKPLRGREVKSRVYDGLHPQNPKGQEAKSSNCLKRKKKENNLRQDHGPLPCQGTQNGLNNMKIDEGNGHEHVLTSVKVSKLTMDENKLEVSSDANGSSLNSQSSSEWRSSGNNAAEEATETIRRRGQEETMQQKLEEGTVHAVHIDDIKNTVTSDNKENDCEVMESDDKENASASDDNRDLGLYNGNLERKILGMHENMKGTQKIGTTIRKPSKERSITGVTGAEGLKHRKLKPTNPKPFRLRTDERRILKDTNLEKKHDVSLKEITSVAEFLGENSQKKEQNAIQSNAKCIEEETENGNNPHDGNKKKTNRMLGDQPLIASSRLKISKERTGQKSSTTPQRHTVSSQQKLMAPKKKYSQDKAAPMFGNNLKRTKSPHVRQKARTPESSSVMRNNQLSIIKETSSTNLRSKEAAKQSEKDICIVAKASSCASRPSLLEKRCTTIPKEPNFHNIHTPKSCTRRVA